MAYDVNKCPTFGELRTSGFTIVHTQHFTRVSNRLLDFINLYTDSSAYLWRFSIDTQINFWDIDNEKDVYQYFNGIYTWNGHYPYQHPGITWFPSKINPDANYYNRVSMRPLEQSVDAGGDFNGLLLQILVEGGGEVEHIDADIIIELSSATV